jgi:hypothetical protein
MLRTISDKMGYDYQLVEDVYFHEFKFVAEQLVKGVKGDYPSFENILLKHLGSFVANEKHINKLKEINDDRSRQVLQGEQLLDSTSSI